MYVHTYMHAYMYAYITYMHACIHTCTHTYMPVRMHARTHAYIHTYIHSYIHYTHAYTHRHIHTYIHTPIHTCIHTHTLIRWEPSAKTSFIVILSISRIDPTQELNPDPTRNPTRNPSVSYLMVHAVSLSETCICMWRCGLGQKPVLPVVQSCCPTCTLCE